MDNKIKKAIVKGAVTKEMAKSTGNKMGVDWGKTDLDQFTRGMNVEREHGSMLGKDVNLTKDNPIPTAQIALAHLKEIKKYYTGLDEMEDKYKKKEK